MLAFRTQKHPSKYAYGEYGLRNTARNCARCWPILRQKRNDAWNGDSAAETESHKSQAIITLSIRNLQHLHQLGVFTSSGYWQSTGRQFLQRQFKIRPPPWSRLGTGKENVRGFRLEGFRWIWSYFFYKIIYAFTTVMHLFVGLKPLCLSLFIHPWLGCDSSYITRFF